MCSSRCLSVAERFARAAAAPFLPAAPREGVRPAAPAALTTGEFFTPPPSPPNALRSSARSFSR